MKYEQPYGVSDPNAAYINGNPSTGTMGSIPPAASIENPQREIVNFIADSGITPSDGDLHQLSKSVQSGAVVYAADTGPQNLIFIAPTPAVAALHVGMRFIIKLHNQNSSAVQVSVSGLAGVPLVHRDLSPLAAFELLAGSIIEIVYDGANFQLIAGGSGGGGTGAGGDTPGGGIIVMTAPRDFYCNPVTGSDTLYDGTSPTVTTGTIGPFLTLQKALDTMTKYNLGGFAFNIHLADGTYNTTGPTYLPVINGSGRVYIVGNSANAQNCYINNTVSGSTLVARWGRLWIDGIKLGATANSPSGDGHLLWVGGSTLINVGSLACNFAPGAHFACGPTGTLGIVGPLISVNGSAGICHASASQGGCIVFNPTNPPSTIITNAISVGNWFQAVSLGSLWANYTTITGAANVSGKKFNCVGNGVIDAQGRGVSYLPGSIAGTLATGGQYT